MLININKVRGHDDVSIRMLKLRDESIVRPLSIIFSNCKLKKTFPNLWEKANVVPTHKKGEKKSHKKIIAQFHFYQYLKNFLKD